MSRVTLQVCSRYSGSPYKCIHDVPGHFTGVFTIFRVTLQVYLRCPRSLKRCIQGWGMVGGGGESIVVVGGGGGGGGGGGEGELR